MTLCGVFPPPFPPRSLTSFPYDRAEKHTTPPLSHLHSTNSTAVPFGTHKPNEYETYSRPRGWHYSPTAVSPRQHDDILQHGRAESYLAKRKKTQPLRPTHTLSEAAPAKFASSPLIDSLLRLSAAFVPLLTRLHSANSTARHPNTHTN